MNQDLSSNPLRKRLVYMQVSPILTNRVSEGVASPSAGLTAFSLLTVESMAAAACGPRGCPRTNSAKPHKEHLRKSRDSRRRQAALLFLTNISLDGRPVYNLNNGIAGPMEAESKCLDVGAAAVTVTGLALSTTSSYGTFTQVSTSISGGAATPLPRTNTYPAPLSPPPAFNQGSCDVFTEDGRIDPLSVQAPPLSPTSGPVNPLLGSSNVKSPGQFPGSNPVPDPRQRWVLFLSCRLANNETPYNIYSVSVW